MMPDKLRKGDEVRVISPSRSMAIVSEEVQRLARQRFADLGLKVTFSTHIGECDDSKSSSINSRVEDLHAAFEDSQVKAIFTTLGGFNTNQLLRRLDYRLVTRNPKILCGYSDITVLLNAIYAKTGVVTYYGPHFSTLGMKKGLDFTLEGLRKCLFRSQPYSLTPSKEWSDDPWYKEQDKRTFVKNAGYFALQEGKARGKIVGGNLNTLNLLQGTEYMPSLKGSILFLEEDDESKLHHFDRDFQSLLHLPGFSGVKGIVLGRFQNASEISTDALRKVLSEKRELSGIPIVANVDFGHTTPQYTFPIGGEAELYVSKGRYRITVTKH